MRSIELFRDSGRGLEELLVTFSSAELTLTRGSLDIRAFGPGFRGGDFFAIGDGGSFRLLPLFALEL